MYLRYCAITELSSPFSLFHAAICALFAQIEQSLAGDWQIACGSGKTKMPIGTMMDISIRPRR